MYVNNASSQHLPVCCVVPQNPQYSIFGPLLFIIYINDISTISNVMEFIFADTNLFLQDTSLSSLESRLNVELEKISSWFKVNKLSLNLNKTNYILF